MAQWSRVDRTLYAKLVYYGPAFGGKTSNLQSLHRILDPQGHQKLLSIKTADDRTLFFDLLPFELGDILGYQVAMKLFTVPGQVRYDTTRQVVLGGADAVVFVADSTASRQEQNVWSLQNLQMNMRAKKLDPARVPVLYQFNKQDVADAASPTEVAHWLGLRSAEQGYPAVAVKGVGVLETFMAACRATLVRILSLADDRTRLAIDSDELGRHLDRAFAPFLERASEGTIPAAETHVSRVESPSMLQGSELLERAVQTGVRLGEKLSAEAARASRLEKETEAFRRLSDALRSVGASFDRDRIIDAGLVAVAETLGASVVSLLRTGPEGQLRLDRAWGAPEDPLLASESGRQLLDRIRTTKGPCVVDELVTELGTVEESAALPTLRAMAAVPVLDEEQRWLLAYLPRPDGVFGAHDVRFLSTLSGHLAVGLEKSKLHAALADHRDRLEETVEARTRELRRAYDDLRGLEKMKERFLTSVSHEMKTPLTAIVTAATALRDYKSSSRERREFVETILSAGSTLQSKIDGLFRLVSLENAGSTSPRIVVPPTRLVSEALELAGRPQALQQIGRLDRELRVDASAIARALANLLENAVKFGPAGTPIEVRIRAGILQRDGRAEPAAIFSVLDRGPGVSPADRERIFAPFEQGGDEQAGKPPGIGLGLHEARTIARYHNGEVQYRPRDGGGSEFQLLLPLEPISTPAAEEFSHA